MATGQMELSVLIVFLLLLFHLIQSTSSSRSHGTVPVRLAVVGRIDEVTTLEREHRACC